MNVNIFEYKKTMMRQTISILTMMVSLSMILHQSLLAQEEKTPNKLFYTELCGPGVIMSANFDSRFTSNERLGFGYRLGAGFGVGMVRTIWVDKQWNYTYTENIRRSYYSFPVGLNYIFGKPKSAHNFEVGAGATFLTQKVSLYYHQVKKPGHAIGFLTFMYRLMPEDGGFSFRVGFTPIIGTSGDLCFSGAVGFGYAF